MNLTASTNVKRFRTGLATPLILSTPETAAAARDALDHDLGPRMTYREIAAEMGTSWQYVQATERRALAKIKAALTARGWTGADG